MIPEFALVRKIESLFRRWTFMEFDWVWNGSLYTNNDQPWDDDVYHHSSFSLSLRDSPMAQRGQSCHMSFTPATKPPMMLALAWKVHQSEVVCVPPPKFNTSPLKSRKGSSSKHHKTRGKLAVKLRGGVSEITIAIGSMIDTCVITCEALKVSSFRIPTWINIGKLCVKQVRMHYSNIYN